MNPILTSGAFEGKLGMAKEMFRLAAVLEGDDLPAYRMSDTFLNVIDTPGQSKIEDWFYVAFGNMPVIADMETTNLPTNSQFKTSPSAVYRMLDFGYKFGYTERAAEEDKYGMIQAVVKSMQQGAIETYENFAASLLNTGLTTVGGWDAKPMYSLTHKYLSTDGMAYGNILPGAGATPFTMQSIFQWQATGVRNDALQIIPAELMNMQIYPTAMPAWLKQVVSVTELGQANPAVPNIYARPILPGRGILLTADKLVPNGRLTNTYDTHLTLQGHHRNMFIRQRPVPQDPYMVNEPSKGVITSLRMSAVVGYSDGRRLGYMSGIGA
jgi:hypothetical protein